MVFCVATSHAADYPAPEIGSYAVCVLSKQQCLQIPSGSNFGSKKSERGNCMGWVNTVQTLLANIKFDPKKPRDPEITRKAIVDAFRKSTVQTIPGYASLDELIAEANSQWSHADIVDANVDGEKPVLHAVQLAVMDLQRDQPGLIDALFKSRPGVSMTKRANEMVELLDERLRSGVPVQLGISAMEPNSGHAVMAIGLEAMSENQRANKFYILDPNHPEYFQMLRVERLGIPGLADDTYFVYDAAEFQGTGTADEIAAKRAELTKLLDARDESFIAKINPKLAAEILIAKNQLRKLMGAIRVESINDKQKSRELLSLAFAPHQLPTDAPDFEALSRAFGRLFAMPQSCPAPPPTNARKTEEAPPQIRPGDIQILGTGEAPRHRRRL